MEISLLRIPLGFYAIVGTEEIKVPGSEVEMFSELTQKAQGKSVTVLGPKWSVGHVVVAIAKV